MKEKRKTLDKKINNLKLKKLAKKQKMQERGITLIALVVTIIILLILAGVTLNIALSDNGLFSKAKKAADEYEQAQKEEEEILYEFEDLIDEKDTVVLKIGEIAEKTQKNNYIDNYGNKATIPKGFKVSVDPTEDDVTEGLVIKDEKENEFVWIPIGNVTDGNNETHKIELKRYRFDENGEVDEENSTTNLDRNVF